MQPEDIRRLDQTRIGPLSGSPKLMNGEQAPVICVKQGDSGEVEIGELGVLRNSIAGEPMGKG